MSSRLAWCTWLQRVRSWIGVPLGLELQYQAARGLGGDWEFYFRKSCRREEEGWPMVVAAKCALHAAKRLRRSLGLGTDIHCAYLGAPSSWSRALDPIKILDQDRLFFLPATHLKAID